MSVLRTPETKLSFCKDASLLKSFQKHKAELRVLPSSAPTGAEEDLVKNKELAGKLLASLSNGPARVFIVDWKQATVMWC